MDKTVRFTYSDLQSFPDDGKRRELIDGEIYVAPAPAGIHQLIITNLFFFVGHSVRSNRLGLVLTSPIDVIFSDEEVTQPDFVYLAKDKMPLFTKRGVEGAPDWVIEVISPSTRGRDYGIKQKLYRKYGVTLYWVIDPETEEVHVWEDGVRKVYSFDDTLTPSLVPGLTLKARDLTLSGLE